MLVVCGASSRRMEMKQKFMICFVLLLLVSPISYAQDKFTISGEVTFLEEGIVFIYLHTQDTYEARIRPPIFQLIEPTDEQKKASKVQFKFEGVPAGTYGLYAFLDVNGDGEVDRNEASLPTEPVGVYRASYVWGWPWDSFKFDLNQDLSGISILVNRWN
jgi:uncharacterized protein (DUF2141 family)